MRDREQIQSSVLTNEDAVGGPSDGALANLCRGGLRRCRGGDLLRGVRLRGARGGSTAFADTSCPST